MPMRATPAIQASGAQEARVAYRRQARAIKAMTPSPYKRALEKLETLKARLRARVEPRFRVVKRQFGNGKVHYKGLAKNTAQIITLFALSNLWLARKRLLAMTGALRLRTEVVAA